MCTYDFPKTDMGCKFICIFNVSNCRFYDFNIKSKNQWSVKGNIDFFIAAYTLSGNNWLAPTDKFNSGFHNDSNFRQFIGLFY